MAAAAFDKYNKIVISNRSVGFDQFGIKEERTAVSEPSETGRKAQSDKITAQPLIAHDPEIPRRKNNGDRKNADADDLSTSATFVQPVTLRGTRPTNVVIGYWRGSDFPDPKDKHAALGIISQSDNFRVKVVKKTRDGRPADGNFPTFNGGMWLSYGRVVLEPQLQGLTRLEVKEYVRARQLQIDEGEESSQQAKNIALAVEYARSRVARPKRPKKKTVFPEETMRTLLEWFNSHIEHPYPKTYQIDELVDRTGLTKLQVSNWIRKARARRMT